MDNELPTDFDLIVLGTGMVESIVSAAASRIGKTVLHLDTNNYYGGLCASFNLEAFLQLDTNAKLKENFEKQLKDNETFFEIGNNVYLLKDVEHKWYIADTLPEGTPENKNEPSDKTTKEESEDLNNKESIDKSAGGEPDEKTEVKWSKESLLKESRKFNIDLNPKVQYARGDFIELLISSNIARYSEYRCVNRVLTWLNNKLEVVPCSRSDIFANNNVSVIEKRMLMKFLTSLDESDEAIKGYENKTFKTFLTDKKLSKNLIHYILYAIANSDDSTSCIEGVEQTKKFLKSLGRFGKTPFLFSMFGSGDLPQEFCRLSAVFGSIFALGQPVYGLTTADNKFSSLNVGKQRIEARNLVMGINLAPESFVKELHKKYISRAVFITDKSILPSEQELCTLLLYPPSNERNPCTVVELPWMSSCCPKNTYLVHITCKQITNPKDDLKECVENLFNLNNDSDNFKPNILYSTYLSIPTVAEENVQKGIENIQNIFLCPGPDYELDFEGSVHKAKKIFNTIYPDEEFLPRAPDPEEIKFETENEGIEESDKITGNLKDLDIEESNENSVNERPDNPTDESKDNSSQVL